MSRITSAKMATAQQKQRACKQTARPQTYLYQLQDITSALHRLRSLYRAPLPACWELLIYLASFSPSSSQQIRLDQSSLQHASSRILRAVGGKSPPTWAEIYQRLAHVQRQRRQPDCRGQICASSCASSYSCRRGTACSTSARRGCIRVWQSLSSPPFPRLATES